MTEPSSGPPYPTFAVRPHPFVIKWPRHLFVVKEYCVLVYLSEEMMEFLFSIATQPMTEAEKRDYPRGPHKYLRLGEIFSKYIINNKEKFFEIGCPTVCHCKNDPLGKLFRRDSFTRAEITQLIRSHLLIADFYKLREPVPPPDTWDSDESRIWCPHRLSEGESGLTP